MWVGTKGETNRIKLWSGLCQERKALGVSGFAALVFLAVISVAASAAAQTLSDEVHIAPRVELVADTVASLNMPESAGKVFKVAVDLVLVPVTIVDDKNRQVKGLSSDNFDIYEGKHQQNIRYFSSEDAPISVGVVLDVSGSMKDKIERAREAVLEFMKNANPQDEFFLITFSDQPQELSGFTQKLEDIQAQLVYASPKGRTALLDALYAAMTKMKQARYQRRALLIISDGGDNHSRYTEQEVKSAVKEADVAMYAIGIYDRSFSTYEEAMGPILLNDFAQLTGGREFTIDNPNDLMAAAKVIGIELRNQYLLGYRPTMSAHDGKWHKIKIKFRRPKKVSLPPVRVYAKSGYYSPAD
jgi:Ca-activated chloride channel family protein